MKSSKRIIYSRIIFVTGIVMLTTLSALFIYETYQETTSSNSVFISRATRMTLEKIFSGVKSREAEILKQMIGGGNFTTISPDTSSLNKEFRTVDSLIVGDVQQKELLNRIVNVYNDVIHDQHKLIQKLHDPGYAKSEAVTNDVERLSAKSRQLRQVIEDMQKVGATVVAQQTVDAQKHTIVATLMGVTVSIFSMIVFILAFYFIDQELKRSQSYLNELQLLNSKIGDINKELEHANTNLHELNNELEEKNIQLEKYAAELSSFTHITSHDMQEPLRKIEFYLSVIEDQEESNLTGEGKKFLDKIRTSVRRMRQLFLSMLDFSLTKTQDNNPQPVDLNQVLQQTRNSLKVYLQDTNMVIESDTLPVVTGVRYQLMQLFENILSNALKFRRHDILPEVYISHERFTPSGKNNIRGLRTGVTYHKISFKDNGIGFEPEYAERIFEIFQRLVVKADSHGVGIGLAICRKIAENHGGTLIANSRPHEGSVFILFIPEDVPESRT